MDTKVNNGVIINFIIPNDNSTAYGYKTYILPQAYISDYTIAVSIPSSKLGNFTNSDGAKVRDVCTLWYYNKLSTSFIASSLSGVTFITIGY